MTWERPAASEGNTHTYFLRITGYYEIDVAKDGPYRADLLNDFLVRPGASTEYGLRLFRERISLTTQR
jgi:hypothetical protein